MLEAHSLGASSPRRSLQIGKTTMNFESWATI